MDPLLVPATWWRLAILLLAWVSTGTTLRRSLLAILTWWRWLLAIALWRCTRRSAVALRWLLTRRSTITLWQLLTIPLGRLLTVALRRCAVLTGWCTVTARCWVGLLVLGVVAPVNGTKK
jgi:hypothetical protein